MENVSFNLQFERRQTYTTVRYSNMKRLFIFPALLLILLVGNLYSKNADAETVHYAVKSVSYLEDIKVKIVSYLEDEKWKVVGVCSNQPNLKIKFVSYLEDKKIKIVSYLEDKKICITNPEDLEEETLRDLGLID